MDCCIFCASELDEQTSPEHILLQSMGGRKTTDRVVCNKCNNQFGSGIDNALAKSVEPIRNIGNFKSGNRRSAPVIRNVVAEGENFDLLPGAIPKPRISKKLSINSLPDGNKKLSINANDMEEFKYLLDAAVVKLDLAEVEAEKFRADAMASAKLISKPAPEFGFQTSYGSIESQRSMAKACLVLWAESMSVKEVLQPRYNTIRKFVHDEPIPGIENDFISIDTRPMPKFDDKFGTNPNIVWVGSNHQGRVMGYFRLYGALGWSIELSKHGAPADRTFCLISNPETPSIWSDKPEANFLNFDWVEEKQETLEFDAVRATFGELLKSSHDRAIDSLFSDIVSEAYKQSGVDEGQTVSKEQWDEISRRIAWKATHALLKLPCDMPIK